MKLLANENFPLRSVLYLKKKGFDICAIGADHLGIRDEEVMELAMKEGRTILTFDRDYANSFSKRITSRIMVWYTFGSQTIRQRAQV